MYEKRKRIEQLLALMVDIIMVFISITCAYLIRYHRLYGAQENYDQLWILYIFLIAYFFVGLAHDWYRRMFQRGIFAEFRTIVFQELVFAGVIIIISYALHRASDMSRLMYGYFFLINTVLIWIARGLLKLYMTRVYSSGRYANRMLAIIPSENAKEVVAKINKYKEWNRKLVGIVLTDDVRDDIIDKTNPIREIEGVPVVAYGDDLIKYTTRNQIDEVFIYDNRLDGTRLLRNWVMELQNMGVIVNVCINAFDIIDSGKKTLNRVGKYATVEYARNIFSFRQTVMKRALDILGALVGLTITALIFPFIALAIKIDSKGPVIFKQDRVGRNGRIFKFYKFRSMSNDAEAQKAKLMAQNEMDGLMFKMEDDPRVTRVGKFLRKTSLDEFPQFYNVLIGDMSLVGTRPPTLKEFEQYEAKHKCRLCMTPGITGMWQVSGRSEITDFDEVVRLDMEYIDDWTIWKDIKILFLTVFAVVFRKGAK